MANTKPDASQINYTAAGGVLQTQDEVNDGSVNLTGYGTPADAATALAGAQAAYPNGSLVHIPSGTWTFPTGYTNAGDRMNIKGAGRWVTVASYSPATPGAALTFNNPGAGGWNQGSISGMAFSSANAITKTAIDLINAANVEVSHIAMSSGSWAGDSIGVRTAGRQFVHIHHSEIVCARPIVMAVNVMYPSLATDHFLIANNELISTSSTWDVIEAQSGTSFSNTTIRDCAIIGGRHGLSYIDSTSIASSFNLNIENCRFEQPGDVNGWDVYIDSTVSQFQSMSVKNVYMGGRNGIRIRGSAARVVLDNVSFVTAGKAAVDMLFTAGSRLTMINCWRQSGTTITLTNARCIRRENIANLGQVEEWIYDASPSSGAQISDVYHSGTPTLLGVDNTMPIAGITFVGMVVISSSEGVMGIYALNGTNTTTAEISDPNGFFTTIKDNAGLVNIYFDIPSNRYVLQNKRASAVTYSVYRIGAA